MALFSFAFFPPATYYIFCIIYTHSDMKDKLLHFPRNLTQVLKIILRLPHGLSLKY